MSPKVDPRLLEQFGARVRARRDELGLTQEAVALDAGLDRTYIPRLEKGFNNATLGTITRLAHALGVTLSYLVEGVEEGVDPTPLRDR